MGTPSHKPRTKARASHAEKQAHADALRQHLLAGKSYYEAYTAVGLTRDTARHAKDHLQRQSRWPTDEQIAQAVQIQFVPPVDALPAAPAMPPPAPPKEPAPKAPAPKGPATSEDAFQGDEWQAKRIVSERVTTLEDLLRVCRADPLEWDVERWSAKTWEMGYKDADDQGQALPLYAVSATFRKRVKIAAARADLAALIAEAKAQMPTFVVKAHPAPKRGLRCVILTPENHFGKHCWGMQTGQDYDLAIALQLHFDGLHRLQQKIAVYDIERFTFGIGNDILNSDNSHGTTYAGTPQDNDGRFAKVFTATRRAMTRSIDSLLEVAPAKVVMVAGNHDQDTAYCLGDALDCRYDGHAHVAIDNSPRFRKYDEFGKNLHGFTHGDKQKIADLPLQMAQDEDEAWGRTKWREWFTGHTHGLKLQDVKGVLIRTISSLSGADAYHSSHGYTHNRRAWEAFLYDPDEGLVASVIDVVQE